MGTGKDSTFVIAGAGLAGADAAATLREEGFEGRLVLIGSEPERPYERPPLSKEYLRGEADDAPFVYEESFYGENSIELRAGTAVTAIDTGESEVELAGGERIGYDRLLIATGAEPRRLEVPGAGLDGVHYLRTLADSQALGERLVAGQARVVVIGGGWIGAEVAASAREKGNEVTILERASVPLERVLGPEVGAIYRDLHTDHGVRFLSETGVEAIEGEGSVSGVRTAGGESIEADLVVVGVGVEPRTELAEKAGIDVGDGILVDEKLETSAPGVFAAGDVAGAEHPFYRTRIRVEHWANARAQGTAAARAMLGKEVSFDEIPYFFSDQYDAGMEYRGYATSWDEVVFRGDVAGRKFIAFWLEEGRVVAGMNVNVWDVSETIGELIRSRSVADRDRLADPEQDLGELVADATGADR